MYRRVMAFDFDGTLATEGVVPRAVESALERCRSLGYALFLVTGRRFETVSLGRVGDLFTGIVWENGAVLSHRASGELYLPFGQLSPYLFKALEEAEIPFERGLAIAATWAPHDQAVWQTLAKLGGGAAVEYNKGAVMLLPPGAAKGSGLERLLAICGLSPRNLAAFGDAENDLSMLTLAEVAIAVADAVPTVRDMADIVAKQPGPAGVLEVLESYPLSNHFYEFFLRRERPVPLGQDAQSNPVTIPASRLAGRNFGVFGDSGTGKSWMVGLLAEGIHHQGYQVLLIDPEGDFRGLRSLPRCVALDGDHASMPTPVAAVSLLDAGSVSIVVDLSRYPFERRKEYVLELLRLLSPIRERRYRPHWTVIEEAQQFFHSGANDMVTVLLPLLKHGGWTFVSYRPDRLDNRVLKAIHQCLVTRLSEPEAVQATLAHCKDCGLSEGSLSDLPTGSALLCGGPVVRLRPSMRRVPHVRHLYKYLDTPLPPEKRFWFRTAQQGVGVEAASLFEFLNALPTLPLDSLEYHDQRQDWAEEALGDQGLSERLRKLSNRQLRGEELRAALKQTTAAHYAELTEAR
jgi:HAD superfamily hydrolase (TIGR01484 family)